MAWTKAGVGTEASEETESEMEGWWERKDHPLLNDVILSNLFKFMDVVDLEECRLVCKKWCELTLSSARSKFEVKLFGNRDDLTRKLTDFVEVFRQNKHGIPFVDYKLNPFCTTEGPGQEFLQICGNTAKKLTLNNISHLSTVKFEEISEILKAMPNIVEFEILQSIHSQSGVDDDKTSKYCPTFIHELLSIAPNITDLQLQHSSYDPNINQVRQILEAIAKFEHECVIRNTPSTEHEHLEILESEGENEESLKLLPQLANLFKNSIESLRVHEVWPNLTQLPRMSKLECLYIRIPNDFDSKSVKLNELFPSLKELELYYSGDEVDGDKPELAELFPNSDPCPNVKSFSLDRILMKIQLFNHILNIFPKLTKFELYVIRDSAQILRRIMTHMTQLEDLSVWGPIEGIESIDAFLTGIPVQQVQKLEHVVTELKEMTVQLREDTIRHYRDRYCQFPSIANLTNLRRLNLSVIGRGDDREDEPARESGVTDVFAYFGLYSMTHINELEILDCEFTKTGCEILTDEMELESWAFQDENGVDIIPEGVRE